VSDNIYGNENNSVPPNTEEEPMGTPIIASIRDQLDHLENNLTQEEFASVKTAVMDTVRQLVQPEPPPTLAETEKALAEVMHMLIIMVPDADQRRARHTLGRLTVNLQRHCSRLQRAEAGQGG
jgi:hypothetical protein